MCTSEKGIGEREEEMEGEEGEREGEREGEEGMERYEKGKRGNWESWRQ